MWGEFCQIEMGLGGVCRWHSRDQKSSSKGAEERKCGQIERRANLNAQEFWAE